MSTQNFETERLIVRPLIQYDFEDFYEYVVDTELAKMYGFPMNIDQELAFKIFSSFVNNEKTFAITIKDSMKMIGHIIITTPEMPEELLEDLGELKGVTMAFAINPNYQRKGYMYEVLDEAKKFLSEKELDYIHCGYYEFNIASKRLQEKLGFQHCGIHKIRRKNEEVTIIDNIFMCK